MKTVRLILVCSLSLLLCCCNSSNHTASDIMAKIVSCGIVLPDAYMYIDTAQEASQNYLSEADFGGLYYSENNTPEELEVIENYCIRISKSSEINEIHIIKTRYKSDNDTVVRMLNCRKKLLTSYEINPNESAFLCEKAKECEVFSKGNFVFLIAGSDISPILSEIEKVF